GGHPHIVHDHDFAVKKCGLVLEDLDPCSQERSVARAGGHADGEVIKLGWDNNLDFHAPAAGVQEGVEEQIIRNRLSMGEEDVSAGGGDGKQVGLQSVFGSVPRAAFEILSGSRANRLKLREIILPVQNLRAGLKPIIEEGCLHLTDDWALDAKMR